MDADPNDIVALKKTLAVERANALEIAAELAVARAKASEDAALIAQQKLRMLGRGRPETMGYTDDKLYERRDAHLKAS